MAVPFAASTWKKVSDLALPTLNGAISGTVSGALGASYYPIRLSSIIGPTMQVFSKEAHSFEAIFNAAGISFDGGVTWTDSYRGDLLPLGQQESVFGTWSLKTPAGVYHYQIRKQIEHSFFAADGTIHPGGIRLYASGPGSPGFSLLQTLYTWPHIIADPPNTGGNNVQTTAPSVAPPILLPGSGPNGENAWWMMTHFRLDVGGTNNRQILTANDLWRSLDGFEWVKVESGTVGLEAYQSIFKSTTGRIIVSGGQGMRFSDGGSSLIGRTWTAPIGFPDLPGGTIFPMYGGTLITTRNGSLISGGFIVLSCDDGANFFGHHAGGDLIPLNSTGLVLKLGPTECLLITNGFADPATETKSYYSADGGETWQDGGVWLTTVIGERPVNAFMKADGHPLVVTQFRVFTSSDLARGVAGKRTICPLANAGLAAARPLVLCGHPIQNNLCEDH
jgi:hypothetical protein